MSEPEIFASALLHWPGSIPDQVAHQQLADRALERLEPGQLIGIGSGSAAYLLLHAIGLRATQLAADVAVVCGSYETETAALSLGLELRQLGSAEPDWALDAGDEVDPDGRLLKRHGGALVKTRLLWATARQMFLASGPAAFVPALGRRSALPVEVNRDGASLVARELTQLGASDVAMRLSGGKDGPVFTEAGNLLLDAHFDELAPGLHADIIAVPGVVETGLFEGLSFEQL